MKWNNSLNSAITEENIKSLLSNRIPYIRIKKFISPLDVQTLISQIEKVGFNFYKNVSPPIGKIGVTVFENQKENKNHYFREGKIISANLFKQAPKHKEVMLKILHEIQEKSGYNSQIATDLKTNKSYFAGLIRLMQAGTLLHIDYAPFDARNFDINKITNQLACNVFLKTPKNGGEVVINNKHWNKNDEQYKINNSYGYDSLVVEKIQSVKIKPNTGDLILFNSRNYHQVLPNKNDDSNRLTLSCFAGLYNENLLFWS